MHDCDVTWHLRRVPSALTLYLVWDEPVDEPKVRQAWPQRSCSMLMRNSWCTQPVAPSQLSLLPFVYPPGSCMPAPPQAVEAVIHSIDPVINLNSLFDVVGTGDQIVPKDVPVVAKLAVLLCSYKSGSSFATLAYDGGDGVHTGGSWVLLDCAGGAQRCGPNWADVVRTMVTLRLQPLLLFYRVQARGTVLPPGRGRFNQVETQAQKPSGTRRGGAGNRSRSRHGSNGRNGSDRGSIGAGRDAGRGSTRGQGSGRRRAQQGATSNCT